MKKKHFIAIVAAMLFLLLVYAAWAKLTDFSNFRFGLSESPFIAPFAGFLVWAVPGIELVISVMLLLPVFRLAGLWAATILMFLFTAYISAMLVFGEDIPCSCGGILQEMSWGTHIAFNSIFVLLGIVGIMLEANRRFQLHQRISA